ncbi:phosphoribosylaminoimidazole carboxylase, chloroplastic-like [Lactuca sativa]|uniref:phosphoribosylaminoimidazole carboxylase, chloroplastic-like n=1 Tax=Lactuca sativa TaxID=4236 RepID=UPI0022AF437F|nr:phosphoribosylaminoimidazole carboxylase, chloroplastic-like [Lactuca sativa]
MTLKECCLHGWGRIVACGKESTVTASLEMLTGDEKSKLDQRALFNCFSGCFRFVLREIFGCDGFVESVTEQIEDEESSKRAGEQFGYPLIVKCRRLAYDGRGINVVAKSEEVLTSAINALGGFGHGLYVEQWEPFVKELAVIVARGRDNSISCYHVVETVHRENICHIVKSPANESWKIMKLATDITSKVVASLEGAGVFAVELFLTEDG